MIWDIVISAILVALYIGSLIGFLLNIGQYRRLDKKLRRYLTIFYIAYSLLTIWIAVDLFRKLLS